MMASIEREDRQQTTPLRSSRRWVKSQKLPFSRVGNSRWAPHSGVHTPCDFALKATVSKGRP